MAGQCGIVCLPYFRIPIKQALPFYFSSYQMVSVTHRGVILLNNSGACSHIHKFAYQTSTLWAH